MARRRKITSAAAALDIVYGFFGWASVELEGGQGGVAMNCGKDGDKNAKR